MIDSITLLFDMNKRPPLKSIVEALLSGVDDKTIIVSTNPADHDYCPEFEVDKGVAISYKNLSEHDNVFIYRLLFKIAIKYGKKEINLKDNHSYPFVFFNEDEKMFLIEEHRWDSMDTDEYMTRYDNDLTQPRILTDLDITLLENEEDAGNDSVWDNCQEYDFLCITETTVYEEDEPSFFLLKYFWKRKKEAYEQEVKRALKDVDFMGSKHGVI